MLKCFLKLNTTKGMILKSLFFMLALFICSAAFAIDDSQYEALPNNDRVIFKNVSIMCKGNSSEAWLKKSTYFSESLLESSLFLDVFQGKLPKLKVSSAFETMISSQGFHLALQECFGNRKIDKDLFFFSLLSLDISGKFVTWAGDITFLKAIFGAVKGAALSYGSPSQASLFARFKEYWHLSRGKSYSILGRSTDELVVAGTLQVTTTLGAILTNTYTKYSSTKNTLNKFIGDEDQELKELEEELENYEGKLDGQLTFEEREDLEFVIDLVQKEIDLKKKKIQQNLEIKNKKQMEKNLLPPQTNF